MKIIKGPILNSLLIISILLNLLFIYLLIAHNFNLVEFVLTFVFFNTLIYMFSYQSFNYIIYNTSEIVIKNQINPVVEQVFKVEDIIEMNIRGSTHSTVLVIKLKNGKQKKVIISNLRITDVEGMINELSE